MSALLLVIRCGIEHKNRYGRGTGDFRRHTAKKWGGSSLATARDHPNQLYLLIETAYEIENSYRTALYDLEERELDVDLTTLYIDERDGMDMIWVRR
jgi:hypothetical protein